jgi:hypothetical protein
MSRSKRIKQRSIRGRSYDSARTVLQRLILAALVLVCFQQQVHAAEEKKKWPCRAIELLDEQPYDTLVCAGATMMARHDYRRAIVTLEKARHIDIFEFPNFMLFPRLALAYHEVGDRAKALEMLAIAELTLKIFTKLLACVEPPMPPGASVDDIRPWFVADTGGGRIQKIDSPYHDAVANIMCGAAYESIYDQKTLDHVASDAGLIRY